MSSSSMTPHRTTAAASNHAVPATPSNSNDNEEGIMVAIRMRPLNSKESTGGGASKPARVWRVLQKYNSVTQTTTDNKPLPERIHGRSFFTYDRTFGEKSSTKEVYEEVAKGIVQSVSSGLNGTIFAYGQTSSGKTYTMQGSGSLQEGATTGKDVTENGGIVHMAAQDIFNHIEKDPERDFLVRVSFIEIYNEEVRDLLVSSGDNHGTLTIREDPRRGVFVNSNETIVTGLDSLLSVLFAGEKNRSVAATGMNERSSRSHTIFRITVESRKKRTRRDDEEDEDEEGDGSDFEMDGDARMSCSKDDDGAVRVSTLNLVDLAGSESVRHTGATGDRQKEGGKINQSLLTLSRVISNLGEKNKHINFRDSKLTRILQPSLSGNARMAVICCATPSELYLEETRSTLQFASRAKLVKTRAQVNEVMDERSLIKKLQRELKEARRNAANGGGQVDTQKMKECEEEAARDRNARRKAEQDLQRLKESILKGGVLGNLSCGAHDQSKTISLYKSLFVYNDDDETIRAGDTETPDNFSLRISKKRKTKRRFSDGVIHEQSKSTMKGAGLGSPLRDISKAVRNKANQSHDASAYDFTSPSKSGTITKIQAHTELKPKKPKPITTHNILKSSEISNADIGLLREALAAKSAQAQGLKAELIEAQEQLLLAKNDLSTEHGEKEMLRMAKRELESQVSALASDKEFAVTEQDFILAEKEDIIAESLKKIEHTLEEHKKMQLEFETLKQEREREMSELNYKNEQLQVENDRNSKLVESLRSEISTVNEEWKRQVSMLEDQSQEALATVSRLQEENKTLNEEITSERQKHESSLQELRTSLEEASQHALSAANRSSQEEIDLLKQCLIDQEQLHKTAVFELQKSLEQSNLTNAESSEKLAAVSTEIELITTTNTELTNRIHELESSSAESTLKLAKTTASLEHHISCNAELSQRISILEEDKASLSNANASIVVELAAKDSLIDQLRSTLQAAEAELLSVKNDAYTQVDSLNKKNSDLSTTLEEKDNELVTLTATVKTLRQDASSFAEQIKTLTEEYEKISSEKDIETDRANQLARASSEKECSLSQMLEETKQTLQQSSTEVAQLRETVECLEAQKSSVCEELQSAKEKIVTLEEELTNKDSNIVELRESAECLEKKLSDATETNSKLELTLSDANNQILTLHSEASSAANELKSLTEEIENVRYENERLVERANQLEATLSDSAKQLSTEVAQVQEILKNSEDTKCSLTDELHLANKKIAALEVELAEKESKIVTLGESEESLKKKLSETSVQYEGSTETNSKLESALSEAKDTIKTLQSEVSTAADEIKSLSDDIANVRSENVRLAESARHLESYFSDSSKQLSDQVTELQNTVSNLEISRSTLSNELQLAKENIVVFEEKLSDKESKVTQLEESEKSLEMRVSKALDQIEELSESNSKLESALNSKDEEVSEAKATILSLLSDSSVAADKIKNLSDELTNLRCENERLTEHAKTIQSSLSESEFNLTQKLTEVNKLLEDSRNDVVRLSGQVGIMESSLQAEKHVSAELEQVVEETEKEVLRLTNENYSADLEIQQLTAKLVEVTAERDDAAAKLIEAHANLVNTTDEKVAMKDQIAQLQKKESDFASSIMKLESTIHKRDIEITSLHNSIESSLERFKTTEKALSELSAEKEELRLKLESINFELSTTKNEKLSATTNLSELESRIEKVIVERDQANAQVSELLSESHSSVGIVSSLQSDKDALEEALRESRADVARLEAEKEEMTKSTARLEKSVVEMKLKMESSTLQLTAANSQSDAMVLEKNETTSKLDELESENQECLKELELALDAKEKIVAESCRKIEDKKMELDECRRKNQEQADEIEGLNEKVRSQYDIIEDLKNQLISELNDASSEISALKSELEASKTRCAALEQESLVCFRESEASLMEAESLNNEKLAKREEMIETMAKETEVLKQDIKILTEDLKLKSAEKSKLESKLELAEIESSRLKEESQEANAKVEDLRSVVDNLNAERDMVQKRIMDLSSGSEEAKSSFAALEAKKLDLEVELKQLTENLANETANFKCIIEGLEKEKNDLNSTLCDSKSTVIDLKEQLGIVTAKCDSLEEDKKKLLIEIESFANEKSRLVDDFTTKESMYQRNISKLEDTLKEQTNEISQLRDRVSSLESAEKSDSSETCAKVESLKGEIQELTRLLASANASVEEARGAALDADEALVAKESELTKALEEIDDLEYALRVAEDKLRLSNNSVHHNSYSPSETHEELLRDMEALMKEKVDAEARLEEELQTRKDFENEVKKAAEEENEKLMMEADETIRLLKEKNRQLAEDLSSAESEVYTTKQEREDLLDRMGRAESKATDLETVIASMKDEMHREKENQNKLEEYLHKLEQESSDFKAQVFAAKASIEAESKCKIETLEVNLQRALTDLSKTQNELNRSKQIIANLTSDIDEYKKELDSVNEFASNSAKMEISELKVSIATLKGELAAAKKECLVATKEKEHEKRNLKKLADRTQKCILQLKMQLEEAKSGVKIDDGAQKKLDTLETKVTELTESNREKDERIEYLEKHKITKQLLETFKQLKVDKSRFEKEARGYKEKVEELEQQLTSTKPRRQGLRERKDSTNDGNSEEIDKLKDDLQQSNIKLRKYVKHCDLLKQEKESIADAISCCNIDDLKGNSLAEKVASLCEKLKSTEEECNALAKSEEKASEYLTKLDSLRKKHDDLQAQLEREKEYKVNLVRAEKRIASLLKEQESLRTLADSAKGSASDLHNELSRQIEFLQNENLQLMEELKSTRKALTETKERMNDAQMEALNEATEDLQGLSDLLSSSTEKKIDPGYTKKEDITETAENMYNSDAEKENFENRSYAEPTVKSPTPLDKKKRKSTNPFSGLSSIKKTARRKPRLDGTPKKFALGESEMTEEATTECNQS